MHNIAIKHNHNETVSFNHNDIVAVPMGCRNNAGIDGHALALILANADIMIELSGGVCALRISREIATRLTFQGAWDGGVRALCDLIIIWDDIRCAVINVLKAANNNFSSQRIEH